MALITHLAKHLRDAHFGGNWTWSNLRDQLADVTWQQATTRVDSLNTIAMLVAHLHYYIKTQIPVLQGGPLVGKDAESWVHPPIESEADWQQMLDRLWADAETLAGLIEQLPEQKLWEVFGDPKYGTYYRNLAGLIEHAHYHLGQIAVVKKLIREPG